MSRKAAVPDGTLPGERISLAPALPAVLMVFLLFLIQPSLLSARQGEFTKKIALDGNGDGHLDLAEFMVREPAELHLSGKALADLHKDMLLSYGWILNADTRNVVWKMDMNNFAAARQVGEGDRVFTILRYENMLSLAPGKYELYYVTNSSPRFQGLIVQTHGSAFTRAVKKIIEIQNPEAAVPGLGIAVEGDEKNLTDNEGYLSHVKEKSIFSLAPVTNNAFLRQDFTVTDESTVRIYAMGEFADFGETGNDYGWIEDSASRTKVWKMKKSGTDYAGGGPKNRKVNTLITLPEGHFTAFYVADGSHSFNSWNAAPPYDPNFWGLTVFSTGNRTEDISTGGETAVTPAEKPFIDLSHLGNNELASQGFSLQKASDLLICAVGESDYSVRTMVDFGWVLNADTRDVVWAMNVAETDWAGGHVKNRIFDRTVFFEPGNYIVYFKTDGFHAYMNWNESPPFDPGKWGITLSGEAGTADATTVTVFNENSYVPEDVVVSLKRVRNNVRSSKKFTLDESIFVRIYALGEGQYGRMVDYGWIEREGDGQTVWEMSYNVTRYAGGSEKNRIADTTILLDAGNYTVHYVSDASHSFGGWNGAPPFDPESWGITLFAAR